MSTKATLHVNGEYYVTVRVSCAVSADESAGLLWEGARLDERDRRARLPAGRVRQAVAESLIYAGRDVGSLIENDDDWDHGGRDWALSQVRRVYGFPADDEASGGVR